MAKVKLCPMCQKSFEAFDNGKFCGSCRENGGSFTCITCGKTVAVKFDTYRKYLKDPNHIWRCSSCGINDTSDESKHPLIPCVYCGAEFRAKTNDVYCPKCKENGVTVRCVVCGECFSVPVKTYVHEMAETPDKSWMHKKCSAEFRKGMWTPEMRANASKKRIARWNDDSDYRNRIEQSRENLRTPEYREKMSQIANERWSDPAEKAKMSEIMNDFYQTDDGVSVRERIANTLTEYNSDPGVRKANSDRLRAFYESDRGKERAAAHSAERRAFFATPEGIEERKRMAERQRIFARSDEGRIVMEQGRQKRLVFMQSDAGKEYRKRQSIKAKEFFASDEGKSLINRAFEARKRNQALRAGIDENIELMRRYWVGVSDIDLRKKLDEFVHRTMDYDFWVEISEMIYKLFGRCSRRDLSLATGINYGTVVYDLQRVGVPPKVKEYRRELEGEVLSYVLSVFDGETEIAARPDFLLNDSGNKMELDIYIPKYNLAIEVNGSYWHSSAHKDKNYHYVKSKLCRENGVRLIHVWEHEWNDTRQRPILESMILSALGQSKRVFARKLSIEVRESKVMREFFESNNIQGFRGGKFAVCLVDPKTKEVYMSYLVGKGNHMSKGYQYEIIRGASQLGYTVVGGSSKLLSHILNMDGIEEIVYYVDYNYFDGRSLKLDKRWKFKAENVSFKNYWKNTGEVKNREPSRHKEITEKYKTGEVLQLWNAGVATYVYTRKS